MLSEYNSIQILFGHSLILKAIHHFCSTSQVPTVFTGLSYRNPLSLLFAIIWKAPMGMNTFVRHCIDWEHVFFCDLEAASVPGEVCRYLAMLGECPAPRIKGDEV